MSARTLRGALVQATRHSANTARSVPSAWEVSKRSVELGNGGCWSSSKDSDANLSRLQRTVYAMTKFHHDEDTNSAWRRLSVAPFAVRNGSGQISIKVAAIDDADQCVNALRWMSWEKLVKEIKSESTPDSSDVDEVRFWEPVHGRIVLPEPTSPFHERLCEMTVNCQTVPEDDAQSEGNIGCLGEPRRSTLGSFN
ncbi:hypothetical protein BD324DRAFT_84588 [Kockovaella imperatae]|uniref:Uncharacterized protein n=1 Tax=Kockovaella imperatae TaxID=4999 RepID=A0A1Y1UCK9_9TREE|nr:hypothetical protein BD324DRAFT_84588 [Kockovaella imperatae]ORX35254.1 hypothetical protein BD324DRAFT_84588 [Kockovaella imperatae]